MGAAIGEMLNQAPPIVGWVILSSVVLGFVGMMGYCLIWIPIADAIHDRRFLSRLPAEKREEWRRLLHR